MFELYDLGQTFINTLSDVGDWLLSRPFDTGVVVPAGVLPDWLETFYVTIQQSSVAQLLVGSALTGILTFKLVKFILDIVL